MKTQKMYDVLQSEECYFNGDFWKNIDFNEMIGVGKNKGVTYRKAKVESLNEKGEEWLFEVKANSQSLCSTIKPLRKTEQQIEKEKNKQWDCIPESIQKETLRLFGDFIRNSTQRNIWGQLLNGCCKSEVSDLSIMAVTNFHIGQMLAEEFCVSIHSINTALNLRELLKTHGNKIKNNENDN